MDYDDYQIADAPPWLSDPVGVLWNRVLGIAKTATVKAATAAVMMRFASKAPLDALPILLEDRGLDPAWNENEASVRARIIAAWDTWMLAGTRAGMGKALELAGYTNYEIIERPQDGTLQWWEFDLLLRPPFPWTDTYLSDGRWDDPAVWDDGGVIVADLPAPDLSRVRLITRKWKPFHAACRYIVVIHAGETWDADAPPGTWDDDAIAIWGDDVSYISP